MNYVGLFTDHHIAMLHDWLTEIGELFMDFSYPHSGGSGSNYFVRRLDDVRGAVQKQWHPEIEIMIFRAIVFPVRGKISSVLLQEALQKIPDDQYYQIVTPDPYPNQCLPLADGKGHEQLRYDLTNLDLGHEVAIGVHPFDVSFEEFDKFYGANVEKLHFMVRKSMNSYRPFTDNPLKYQGAITIWESTVNPS